MTSELKKMKIFVVDFTPMWPVPYGLIIAANTKQEALALAKKTIKHTNIRDIKEITPSEPCVLYYESGDY